MHLLKQFRLHDDDRSVSTHEQPADSSCMGCFFSTHADVGSFEQAAVQNIYFM